jgi:cytochrome c
MGLKGFVAGSALLLLAGAAQAQAPAIDSAMGGPGDAAHGEVLFKQRCGICHKADKDAANGVGPLLFGVYGRHSGMAAGYMYSAGLKASNIIWTPDKLNAWIQKPQALVPGSKMVIPAPVVVPQERADIIAYLKTKK